MEKVLKVENGEAKLIREELELIPEFAALLTYKYNKQAGDTEGKKRYRATKEFTYLWFMYSHLSSYREYSDSERHTEALLAADLPEKYPFSEEFAAAAKKYQELNRSRILKLIIAAEKAVDNLRTFFENVDFTQRAENGTLIFKPSEVIKAIMDLDKVASGLEKLAQRQKNEVKEGSATRGGQEEGWIMDKNDYDGDNGAAGEDDGEF